MIALEQCEFGLASGTPRTQIQELAALAFVQRATNAVFLGTPASARGTWRSHRVYGAVSAGANVPFMPAADVTLESVEAGSEKAPAKLNLAAEYPWLAVLQ